MAIFNSKLLVYQRVIHRSLDPHMKLSGASCICYIGGIRLYYVVLFSWLKKYVPGHEWYYMSMVLYMMVYDMIYRLSC